MSNNEDLVKMLRERGLRKKVARSVADGIGSGGPRKKPPVAVAQVTTDLRKLADEIEDRATGRTARRKAAATKAATKAATTRAENAKSRSSAAKKAAQTRASQGPSR
jgi:hypothetical protein